MTGVGETMDKSAKVKKELRNALEAVEKDDLVQAFGCTNSAREDLMIILKERRGL